MTKKSHHHHIEGKIIIDIIVGILLFLTGLTVGFILYKRNHCNIQNKSKDNN